MTDLDLTDLRRIAQAMDAPTRSGPKLMLALIDRIEALEAERDSGNRNAENFDALYRAERIRADRAEARLARVTDDSMVEKIDAALFNHDESRRHEDDDSEADAVLTVIRAVAADEQEDER